MPVTTRFQSAGLSDPGLKRGNNEDRCYIDVERGIFLVVDGMGGEAAGETAAEIAVNIIRARLERDAGTPVEKIREAIALANNEIFQAANRNPAWKGMACVLTAALVSEDKVTIGHVGDSRLYLLSPGKILKITPDHSPVGEREDAGEISESQAMQHPRRNEVFRDVGSRERNPDDPAFIEVMTIPFQADQAILLCSDGLSDMLTAQQIRQTVERNAASPKHAVTELIRAANEAGGKDNVTVVLVEQSRYAATGLEPQESYEEDARRAAPSRMSRWLPVLIALVIGLAAGFLLRPKNAVAIPDAGPPAAHKTWVAGSTEAADSPTISGALDKASAGDRVVVGPGLYAEQVKLRDGIDVVSQEPQGAVLQSELGDAAVVGSDLKSGHFSGFRIAADSRHTLAVGIVLKNANVQLEDLEIAGATIAGIEIRGSGTPTVLGSRILGKPLAAIAIYDTAKPRIVHCLLAKPGIRFFNQGSAIQTGNVIAK